jgi:hypothetical protein
VEGVESAELALVLALLARAATPDTEYCRWCGGLMTSDNQVSRGRSCMHVGGHERGWVDDVEVRDLAVLAHRLSRRDVSAALEVALVLKAEGAELELVEVASDLA